jgi:hypothetical protein
MHCYNTFPLLHAYFLPTHGIGTLPVLGQLSYGYQYEEYQTKEVNEDLLNLIEIRGHSRN